jgi:hypothetical protein
MYVMADLHQMLGTDTMQVTLRTDCPARRDDVLLLVTWWFQSCIAVGTCLATGFAP